MKQAERRNPSISTGLSHGARHTGLGAVGLLMAALVASCASFQETPAQKAQRIDPVLSAAGFHMLSPDSPKKQELFASMPPLAMHYYVTKDGRQRYWFADPYECNCLYEGDDKAYQRYQNLRLQQKLVKEEEQAAELNQDAAMQMNMYDPMFYPY